MTLAPISRRLLLGGAAALALGPGLARAQDALEEQGYALGDMTMGDPDAPVTIIEYSSLTCPHCASFHTETWPELEEKYVETGQVRLIFREVYFDQLGLWSSMIARCAGEAPFFGYVTEFLERQQEWARADDPVAEIRRIGRLGGLSEERVRQCLTDEDLLRHLVERYQENATEDEVTSTPTFIINGDKFSGAMGVERFSELIEERL